VFALVPQYQDPRDTYARALLAQQCLEGEIDGRIPPPGVITGAEPIDPRTGQRNFNLQVAQQYGYELPPQTPAEAQAGSIGVGSTQEQAVECGQRTRERLGLPPAASLAQFVNAGFDAVSTNTDVQAASAAWRQCMTPAGVIDLPETPADMPTSSVQLSGDRAGVPLAAERAIAIADATCRVSSGYDEAVLNARTQGELTAIGRDLEGFESTRAQYVSYGERIDRVVQELGG
jgi:hypothetical protein